MAPSHTMDACDRLGHVTVSVPRPPVSDHAASVGTAAPEMPTETARRRQAVLLPPDILDGGEVVIFAIKPSLLFLVGDSAKWLVLAMVAIIGAAWSTELIPGLSEAGFMSAVLAVAGVRLGIALLRWVSRFYVLTNRRAMRIRGVFRPEVFACPLNSIRSTRVAVSFAESLANLGTIRFDIADLPGGTGSWPFVNNPHEVHARIRRAIDNARHCQPRI